MHIRTSVSALVLALALATPALAQQPGSLSDFQLPPDPDATSTPEVQGPVDPEAEVRTTPRVIATDSPTPQPTSTVRPAPTPSPTLTLPRPTPTRRAAQPETRETPQTSPTPAAPTPAASPDPTVSEAAPLQVDLTPSVPPPAPVADAPEESDGSILPWLAALVAALGLAGAGAWYFRRREALAPVPVIEPPLARRREPPQPDSGETPAPEPAPAPTPPPVRTASIAPVTLQAQPVRLSRSMMNATFAFRVVLENQGAERWEDVSIEADLVTAHGTAPIAEQVASPEVPLAPLHAAPALEPGQTIEFAGEVRLPVGAVRAIPQGRAAVYVPLLRLRVTSGRRQPLARTFLIGQLPDRQGGRLRPFRLDEMPQSYHAIGMRPLD